MKLADEAASDVEWRLEFKGLSGDEWRALEGLHTSVQGQLRTFLFLDPASNLLAWSSGLSHTAWQQGGGLRVTEGVADPLGGTGACSITNSFQAPQRLLQSIAGPGCFQYCLSLYACAPAADTVTLVHRSGSEEAQVELVVGNQWQRFTLSSQLTSSAENVEFGIELQPGTTVLVYGIQAEAQPQAGAYRETRGQSGVYPNARFTSDSFEVLATDPEQYACAIAIRSRGE
ncbi:MAG: hypothetical protein ABI693_20755 [Bryobacteraceae bacterium]